ncbi:hypothetical protein [Pseudoroseicyclus aestuarii]|uniref:Putative secreted protein n=1 Tax=Pseudoroseicyclus aestuarii TaxID=1795041 RepID=A0A318SSJ7_9RHOB|nr:hypothetical protein [Pseudoroseicyclus aestuarii]PYE82242.1 putative secreted protein [Pseudoroseicyclus aestuarii]
MSLTKFAAASALALGLAAGPASAATLGFIWDKTPYSAVASFSLEDDFDLYLDSYQSASASERSGYYLRRTDEVAHYGDTDACTAAGDNFVDGCYFLSASTADNTLLLSGLAAGDYELGFYESARPASGTVTFSTVSLAAVPLPAGGALLLGALGALGLRRRRRA